MFTLHAIAGEPLEEAVLSIGILNPAPSGGDLELFDFGLGHVTTVKWYDIVAVAQAEPARVSFAPELGVESLRMAANRAKVLRFQPRRKKPEVPTSFVTGYERYSRDLALYWREHGVGTQPLLAAGVFSLSSIQTPITSALRLFAMLTPHVIDDQLPAAATLRRIVQRSRAGFHNSRTRWYESFASWRHRVVRAIDDGLQDDPLRRELTRRDLPEGLGLAKLSFTLALVGQNLGCLDARILTWAFGAKRSKTFTGKMSKTRSGGYSPAVYNAYRRAERDILMRDSPFYDPDDPVALARSQWMLWESLGPPDDLTHTHEELYRAVLDPRLLELL